MTNAILHLCLPPNFRLRYSYTMRLVLLIDDFTPSLDQAISSGAENPRNNLVQHDFKRCIGAEA
jgi:hypothetical protein